MKSNKQCIKDIIKYISENTYVKISPDGKDAVLSRIGLSAIITELSKDEKYQKDEILYNFLKCHKLHLIEANIHINKNVIVIDRCEIHDTTIAGEKFLIGELEL